MLLKTLRLASAAALCAAVLVVIPEPAGAVSGVRSDPSAVTKWNAIAARTIFAENVTPVPPSSLYFGFVSLAVYDAVVAVEGGYRPYARPLRAAPGASTEAAVAAAAHDVLAHYFPASTANLDTDYVASLAAIPEGRAKAAGVRTGRAAAAQLIRLREGDGRNAPIMLHVDPEPGVWRPTPDAYAPMVTPWLGFVDPLALRSSRQLRLSGPDPITSPAYARDLAEVKAYGAATGSLRTPWQTETALFWNANAVLQFEAALREQVTRRGFDTVRTARAFALLGTATADALIGCWRAKYEEPFWRPITAIREAHTDGNPATAPDPAWTPLQQAPPYPEYPSGHACVTGAATGTFSYLFGADAIDLNVSSSVTNTIRHYDSAAALEQEARNARIWLGFHFRKAMNDGNRLGHFASRWTIAHEFRPVCRAPGNGRPGGL